MERLTEHETQVMEIFWHALSDWLSKQYVLRRYNDLFGKLNNDQLDIILIRLQEKGLIENDDSEMRTGTVYRYIIEESVYVDLVNRNRWEWVHRNRISNYIFSLVEPQKLSKEDLEELEKMLDREIDEDELD